MVSVTYKKSSIFNQGQPIAANDAVHVERQKAKREQVKQGLINWGAWYRENIIKPINELTGVRNVSLSAILMRYAPKQEKTGYYDSPPLPIDNEAAVHLNEAMKRLKAEYQIELHRFYVDRMGTGTTAESTRRDRAIIKLVSILNSA